LGLILSSLERGELLKATPGELLKATPQQSKAQANQSRMTEAMTTPMTITIQITPTMILTPMKKATSTFRLLYAHASGLTEIVFVTKEDFSPEIKKSPQKWGIVGIAAFR
jgi:hypothetical protein